MDEMNENIFICLISTVEGCDTVDYAFLENNTLTPSVDCNCPSSGDPTSCVHMNQASNITSHQLWFQAAKLLHGFEIEADSNVLDPLSFEVDVWDVKVASWRNFEYTIETVSVRTLYETKLFV